MWERDVTSGAEVLSTLDRWLLYIHTPAHEKYEEKIKFMNWSDGILNVK